MKIADPSLRPVVVKVGGSLFDLPDLGLRLRRWLLRLDTGAVLLVPGGGKFADAVRDLDKIHLLGEEKAHWLALRALTLSARFLVQLLPGASILGHPWVCSYVWERGQIPVLDAHEFALIDESKAGRLPHAWTVTSDSIAARVSRVLEARRLVLLKSVTIPEGTDWREARRCGWVDDYFAEAVGTDLEVQGVNLRDM
jgi:aspartokinase-like uncharacterized kinase